MNEDRPNESPALDLTAIRARLAGVRGQEYWQSLEELADTPEFREQLHREFPDGASEWFDNLSRRSFLKMAAASLALAGLTACTKRPHQAILPYVKQPEELVPGEPLLYATTMPFDGYGIGVLATSRDGHPIKLDGNPEHPSSLGRSSVWMQAAILDLYDPDRSQSVVHNGELSTWAAFESELSNIIRQHSEDRGASLRFLSETATSPTLANQMQKVLGIFPEAKWVQFNPVCRDNVLEGARQAFGKVVATQHRFDRAAVIVSLESDFLYAHPEWLRYAREFTNARRVRRDTQQMNRLYVAESTPTVTGSMADHRLPIESGAIPELGYALAHELQLTTGRQPVLKPAAEAWVRKAATDLQREPGRSIVIAGEWQPPEVHTLVHQLNDHLGNVQKTILHTASAEAVPSQQLHDLQQLADEMKAGRIQTLFILGGNPAYDVPADLDFTRGMKNTARIIHLGTELNETAALCTWHLPEAHFLEAWGDARSFDGTVSLQQPLIEPLYGGRSALELIGGLEQAASLRSGYELLVEFWRSQNRWPDFEKGWRRALHDGLVADSALPEEAVSLESKAAVPEPEAFPNSHDIDVVFRPDPSMWDGSFANNGWLQECAKPITKLTWGNAVLISPALAQHLQLSNNDVVEISSGDRMVRGPVWITPGQAENSVTLHLGFGRERSGRIGTGVGFNAYALRTSDTFWRVPRVSIKKTNQREILVATQTHHNLHSPEWQIYREGTLREFAVNPEFVKASTESPEVNKTLYDPDQHRYDGYKWGMSIDLNTCIGCNACLMACNAENNIPVVGKEQVRMNREMYWIRIDTYYRGTLDNPEFSHMPVPCMHCEHAPCELVCPVAATVHDHEGLNLQIYNRCVGTRFCSNNCPYKVRRFNFLQYADYKTPSLRAMFNPDVTVRWRGVMEKCTYCIQRISRARITAEKENRRIADGEIQTACQQSCPTDAIVFGDLNDPNSRISKLKQEPLDYPMLGQLNTRPRTTYLAKLRNPQPETNPAPLIGSAKGAP